MNPAIRLIIATSMPAFVAATSVAGQNTAFQSSSDLFDLVAQHRLATSSYLGGMPSEMSVCLAERTDAATLLEILKHPQVKELCCSGITLPEAWVPILVASPYLESLRIKRCTFPSDTGRRLLSMPRLKHIDFTGSTVKDATFAGMAEGLQIESLDLSHTEVTGDSVAAFAKMPHLRRLYLSGCAISDANVAGICRECPSLCDLWLRGTNVTDECTGHLIQLRGLRQLSLAQTRTGDIGVKQVLSNPAIEYLDLSETHVTDAVAINLAVAASLKYLLLHATSVSTEGVIAICANRKLKTISYTTVNGKSIDYEDLERRIPGRIVFIGPLP